jgi:hypothetical protein
MPILNYVLISFRFRYDLVVALFGSVNYALNVCMISDSVMPWASRTDV